MNKYFRNLLIMLGFVVPYILIYRIFFMQGSLAFGDAPFFAPENLKELFNFPFVWNFRNDNFGAPQYHMLWLYLPTYLYGLLNHFLGLSNDILVRLIFYFPATILAIIGSWKFIGKFNQNIYGKFLGSLLYSFNTYFLMVIDGGQVGIALAYGLFPLSVLYTINYLEQTNVKKYTYALISLFILFNIDIRIGLISVLLSLLIWLALHQCKQLRYLINSLCILGFSILGLCSFWVLPTLLNFSLSSFVNIGTDNNFINLSNSLFLFQPHFPLNQFGKLSPIPFYFCLIPILIFGNLLFLSKFKKIEGQFILKISLLFLLFVFITKGSSSPQGEIFIWIINHLPAGSAFRDSSKFFIPLVLVGGLLLSYTINGIERIVKNKLIFKIFIIGIYGYLLFLIYPALLANLSGALGQLSNFKENDYQQIYTQLNQDQNFFKTLYIEEKPAKFYGTFEKPILSANTLYKERPFTSMIVGKYDFYNFLHNQQLNSWFNLLGIKYVFLPENERKKILSLHEQKERNEFINFTDKISGLNKLNLRTSFPVYEISGQSMPHIFAQKKALFIVGSESIYNLFFRDKDFKLQNQGLVFLEDGKTDPESLQRIDPDDMTLIFFKKDKEDLLMSYFQDTMFSLNKVTESQWKFRNTEDYLIWKYDLLLNEIESYEFDYGKGVAFSTIANERLKLNVNIPQADNYYLSIRYTNSTSSAGLKVSLPNQEYNLFNKTPQQFKWSILGPLTLKKGQLSLEIINKGGFVMLNTLNIISDKDLKEKEKEMNNLLNKTEVIYLSDDKDIFKITPYLRQNYMPINYQQINPTKYNISNLPKNAKWLVFSDHFDKGWQINDGLNFSFYSMINGFYMKNIPSDFDLSYLPQKNVITGIKFSLLSLGIICVIFIYLKKRK